MEINKIFKSHKHFWRLENKSFCSYARIKNDLWKCSLYKITTGQVIEIKLEKKKKKKIKNKYNKSLKHVIEIHWSKV